MNAASKGHNEAERALGIYYYQGFDYRWDAEQDRIIYKIGDKKYKGGYVAYSKERWLAALANKCNYMIEYHKENKLLRNCCAFWKLFVSLRHKSARHGKGSFQTIIIKRSS